VDGDAEGAARVRSRVDDDRGGHLWEKDRQARTADGTLVRYTVVGDHGPAIVCCAGFLCPDNFWRDLVPDLARDHRVVVLNYRGIGASSEARGAPHPLVAADYTIERFADDVAATLDAERIRAALVLGHSMGVQVALALWRQRPELVGELALVTGPFASPLRTFYGTNLGVAVFPVLSSAFPALPRDVSRLALRSLKLPGAMGVARAVRAIGPATPVDGMRLYRDHLAAVDPRTAIWTARGMHTFDAGGWLHEVDVPTSVVAGSRDAWCPPAIAERMVDRLPDATLTLVPGASHTLPIEFPDRLVPLLRRPPASDDTPVDARISTRPRRTAAASTAGAAHG
jgi:pimeloyl-ACP methyl ester carboxylesterase